MNIFFRELKAYRKSLILWSVGMFFMVIGGMGKYTSYSGSPEAISELMAQIPKSIKAILGMGEFNLTTASGFYGMLFLYLVILSTIHAAMLGANIIAKEERDKTAEFLFVKPVSRNKIITSKLLAALVNIAAINIITLVFSIALVGYYAKGENINGDIIILMAGMFVLQLLFLSLGIGIASVAKRPKIAASIATAILLFSFILSAVVDLNSNLEFLKYITPFKYFDAKYLIDNKSFDPVFTAISFVIISVCITASYTFYKKRDLKV